MRSPLLLLGSPKGRVSDRTRNAPSRSDKQQGEASSKAAREDGAYGAEFKSAFLMLFSPDSTETV